MITALRSINFSGCKPNQVQNNKQTNYSNSINQCKDMVSFSGSAKLSQKNNDFVQSFAKELELNKVYKFEFPNIESFQLTSIKDKTNPDTRSLIIQYSDYSKSNMTRHIAFMINNGGEVIESGIPVKSPKTISAFEQIIPALLNKAAKELKLTNIRV